MIRTTTDGVADGTPVVFSHEFDEEDDEAAVKEVLRYKALRERVWQDTLLVEIEIPEQVRSVEMVEE